MSERIRVGIGGWTYEPWRDNFYPKGLKHADELKYASSKLTAIEINGTFYSRFKPANFAKWRDETPEGFVFSMKAHRFTTHRKVLATAGEGIANFMATGLDELRDKLGPVVWQLMPTQKFDAEDFEAFLKLLPPEVKGRPLQHVIDARHASFAGQQYLDLLHRYGCSTVYTDDADITPIPDPDSPLAYLRLMRTQADCETGYPVDALRQWAEGAKAWVAQAPRQQVYAFFISGAKERAPGAATALLSQLGFAPLPMP